MCTQITQTLYILILLLENVCVWRHVAEFWSLTTGYPGKKNSPATRLTSHTILEEKEAKRAGFCWYFFYLGGKTFHARKDLFRNEGSSSGDTIF